MKFKYRFRIRQFEVIDGDTVDVELDMGLGHRMEERIRMANINAPETRTKNLDEKARGLAAKSWLQQRMEQAELLVCESVKFRRGKYGRVLGYIVADGANLNLLMLEENIVDEY